MIIFVLMTIAVSAQQTLPCTQIGVNNLGGQNPYITGSCLEVSSDLHVNNKNVIMEADNRIHFGPGSHISPVQQGNLHASIRPNALQVAWMEPGTMGSVGQYKKLELGIKLNNEIEALIDEFIAAGKSDVAPRTNPSLNPFDPDEIDVYAEFYYQQNPVSWAGPYRQNGFFFEDFVRNQSDPDPVNWTWDKVQSDYRFRIRFAPRKQGIWKCRIIAEVHGYWQYSTSFFTFNVTPSDGHDFVSVGPNKRFLKIGSEPFFPVGMNLTDPMCYIDQNGTWDYPPDDLDPYNYGCIGFPDATYESGAGNSSGGTTSRLKVYTVFEQELEAFADAGANYFKMDIMPWFSDIEFEQICNYYNRMHIGWEVDNIVEKSEQEGLFIHFNTAIQYYFLKPDHLLWDWSAYGEAGLPEECDNNSDHGYCYNSDLGLTDPKLFFSDYYAKDYYQKRLRYMIARWGYSTNISAFETINEINGTCGTKEVYYNPDDSTCNVVPGSGYSPYNQEVLFRQNVNEWQSSMLNSMTAYMGHNQHLTSVNYLTDGPNISDDTTYYLNSLDIITQQNYRDFPDIYKSTVDIVNDLHDNSNASSFGWTYCDKPFIHGEYGSGTNQGYYMCDNDASWIRDLWIGSFTGICGSALLWDNQHKRELWPHFGRLRSFVQGIDFDNSGDSQHKGWTNENDLRGDNLAEMMCLRNWEDNHKQAIGVIANRTYNYYTQAEGGECQADIPMVPYNSALNIGPVGNSANYWELLMIPKMGSFVRYNIEFYNVMTGQFIQTFEKVRSDVDGELFLEYPQLTGNAKCPIVLFKIYKWKDRSMLECLDTLNRYSDESNSLMNMGNATTVDNSVVKSGIKVFPNPANDILNITYSGIQAESIVQIFSTEGRLILLLTMTGQNLQIPLDQIVPGIYIIVVQNEEDSYHEKFIKN